MIQFDHTKKSYVAFTGLILLCAYSAGSFARGRDTSARKDTLQKKGEMIYSYTPALKINAKPYVFGAGVSMCDTLRLMATIKKSDGIANTSPLNKLAWNPASLKPKFSLLPANAAVKALNPFNTNTFQFGNKLQADTLPKPNIPTGRLLSASVLRPSSLQNSIAVHERNIQNITNTPAQFVKGINGLGTGKDQMQKMAALRAQLISESISKNFGSLARPSLATNLSIENDFLYQPALATVTGKKYQNITSINGSLMAFGIPLNINISNNQSTFGGVSPLNSSLFKFGFSPSMFSGLLKSDLQQYADLKNSVFHGFSFTNYIHQTIIEKVKSIDDAVLSQKNSPFAAYLENPSKLQGMIRMPDKELRQLLDAAVNEKYLMAIKQPNANEATEMAKRQLNYQKADSLAIVVNSVRTELKKNEVSPDKLLLAENYLSGNTSPAFNASEMASGMFTKKSANAFQSLFGGIKDLRFGSFGNQVPGSTGDDAQLMKGANIGIKLGDYPLTFGYGSLNDINSVKDAGYQTSVFASPKNITYIGTGIKRGVFGDIKIAVVSSFNGQANDVHYLTPTLPGNAVAFTVTKAIKLEKFGNFSFDVSKSGTLFSSSYQPGSEAILEKKAGVNTNLSTNLFQAVALGFTHNLDISSLHASDNVYFNYAGLGYQNPANNGYSGATMKFGGNLRKSFYQNKLSLNFRTDYRSMPLSYTTNDKWKNYQVQIDSRYQFSNKLNVSLRYIEAATNRSISGTSVSVFNSKKFELSGYNTSKIGKYTTTSHLSISSQSLTNTYTSATGSSLLNLNYAQSLILKNSSLTATLFYNKELASYVIIGDMLTTDLTYQFVLFKNIQLSSGVTYLNNTNIAKQFGVRQGLQVAAGKHFDFNASVDLRKNLITPQYADLYASCRGELAIKYYFKID